MSAKTRTPSAKIIRMMQIEEFLAVIRLQQPIVAVMRNYTKNCVVYVGPAVDDINPGDSARRYQRVTRAYLLPPTTDEDLMLPAGSRRSVLRRDDRTALFYLLVWVRDEKRRSGAGICHIIMDEGMELVGPGLRGVLRKTEGGWVVREVQEVQDAKAVG